MDVSSDPYEQKLFQMFQSCDTDSTGLLNEKALRHLCEMLELRDNGSRLIDDLAAKDNSKSRVSFEVFKEALLNFLGTELDGTSASSNGSNIKVSSSSATRGESILIIKDDVETYIDSPPESSEREVSPKLVVGSKKYGRRSRPQMLAEDSTPSDSETETILTSNGYNSSVQRSSSQTDINPFRRRRPASDGTKLKRCASLPAQKNQRTREQCSRKTMASASQPTATPEELSLLAKQKCSSSIKSLDIPAPIEVLSAHNVIAVWERAGISHGKGLLLTLGFDEEEINLSQLSKVLEEELRSLEGEPQTILLKASLALQSAELTALRQTLRQLRDENKKLHADNKDANRRVAMLAQEIDERHASLEDTTKKEIRLLEQRHAEVVRDLTLRLTSDRENWTNLTANLESKLKSFEHNEIRLRTDLELIRNENSALEEEQKSLHKQITDLLETNIKLNHEITDMEDRSRADECSRSGVYRSTDDEVLKLLERISALQMENANLRDRNDELVSEVEALNMELSRARNMNKKLNSPLNTAVVEANEVPLNALEQNPLPPNQSGSPSKAHSREESLGLKEMQKETDVIDANDTSGGECTTAIAVEEVESLKNKVVQLEAELKALREERQNATEERCQELEASLDQMQRAYEDCEDYWQNKLAEERQLFDKERQIYEEEQQESDKKFTELMEKVREYEEQFSKDGRLTPIEEKDTLEQQYADLEAEAEQVRENARLMFEEKCKEIELLQRELEDLRMRLGESVEILTGATELNNEVAQKGNEIQSPANSPISYLWHQSTIQSPVQSKEYENSFSSSSPIKERSCTNLSSSETAVFSATLVEPTASASATSTHISPIQKPVLPKTAASEVDCDSSSSASGKSFESHSVASTHSVHHSRTNDNANEHHKNTTVAGSGLSTCSSSSSPGPSSVKEELKRLKFFEMSLKEQIKDLTLQRDGLVMELQQLQEARPVLEKAYARTTHPSLLQRINQLELKNRHLQNAIKQQQQYTESLMQQSWQQHHAEVTDLRNRIEAQNMMIAEQAQKLQNADIFVKELYVENSHLTATVQRMEQQRTRANLLHQHQGLSGFPGLSGLP